MKNTAKLLDLDFTEETKNDKFKSTINSINHFLLRKTFFWRIRYFFISMKNIIKWIPILYKDRDWDHSFILYIIEFKLKNIRNRYVKTKYFVGQDKEIYWLNICLYLLDYINKSKAWDDKEENKYLNFKNIEYVIKHPELLKLRHWKCDAREEKVLSLFWKIISWRITYWWD
jgi:hypothetical protein